MIMLRSFDDATERSIQEPSNMVEELGALAYVASRDGKKITPNFAKRNRVHQDPPSPDPIAIDMSALKIVEKVQIVENKPLVQNVDDILECLQPLLFANGSASHQQRASVPSAPRSYGNQEALQYWDVHNLLARGSDDSSRHRKRTKSEDDFDRPAKKSATIPATIPSSAGVERSNSDADSQSSRNSAVQVKGYQSALWDNKFEDLCVFQREHGNCLVPHNWDRNPGLAKWVKRQRYQYKLKKQGKHSTLTDEREKALHDLGFIWDSHKVVWEERLAELMKFKETHGHCNVPSTYNENHSLSIWVQCQRRQYKLFREQKKQSHMNEERIARLESIGFIWKPRKRNETK